jgi:hypothetical protein
MKNTYFCVGCVRRSTQNIEAYFLITVEIISRHNKKLSVIVNHFLVVIFLTNVTCRIIRT